MTIKEMHYDFKQKLNKIDSQNQRNLLVPEIDWKLNEAQEIFVKIIAEPRLKNGYGFEINQRTIDDIRTLVVNQSLENSTCQLAIKSDDESFIVELPEDYWFHVSSEVYATKGNCSLIRLDTIVRQHDDRFKNNPFDNSSFEWREANIRFFEDKIKIYTDKSFEVNYLCLDYIKKPVKIYNAESAKGGQYRDLGTGLMLTGTQDCELPEHTHREIVDLAVYITAGDLQMSDIQTKLNKINSTK